MWKKLFTGLATMVLLLVLGFAAIVAFGSWQLTARVELPPETFTVPPDPALIAEGERLSAIHQCTGCHGTNLAGTEFIASDAFARLPAPNLTRGAQGLAGRITPAQWEQAIRHGVGRDGRSLIIMPSTLFASLTDRDVAAMIAYAEHAPPVDSPPAERTLGPIIRLVAAFRADDLLPARSIDHAAPHREALEPGNTAELGTYLSRSCAVCHHADLAGGPLEFDQQIYAANLTPDQETGLGSWSLADFTRLLREGRRPDHSQVNENMPWEGYARFSDAEIAALWDYLAGLPAIRRAPEIGSDPP